LSRSTRRTKPSLPIILTLPMINPTFEDHILLVPSSHKRKPILWSCHQIHLWTIIPSKPYPWSCLSLIQSKHSAAQLVCWNWETVAENVGPETPPSSTRKSKQIVVALKCLSIQRRNLFLSQNRIEYPCRIA
jgi:hypothetical protein